MLYIGYDGRLLGILALRDITRPERAATIIRLRDAGGRVANTKALANATMDRVCSNYRLIIGTNVGILSATMRRGKRVAQRLKLET